jgi:hypothetical protein
LDDPAPEDERQRQRERSQRRRERERRPERACDRFFDRAYQSVARGRELRVAPRTVVVERLGEIRDLPGAGAVELARQVEGDRHLARESERSVQQHRCRPKLGLIARCGELAREQRRNRGERKDQPAVADTDSESAAARKPGRRVERSARQGRHRQPEADAADRNSRR